MAEWFIKFKFWWLSHQSVGLNPGHGTCVLEQDALLVLLLFTPGYKCVPSRVVVGIVFAKAFGALWLPRPVYSPGS